MVAVRFNHDCLPAAICVDLSRRDAAPRAEVRRRNEHRSTNPDWRRSMDHSMRLIPGWGPLMETSKGSHAYDCIALMETRTGVIPAH